MDPNSLSKKMKAFWELLGGKGHDGPFLGFGGMAGFPPPPWIRQSVWVCVRCLLSVLKIETHHHSRSNRVSLFYWNTRDISLRNESEKCHVYFNGKSETRFQRE